MAQSVTVMAFRKRLKGFGYTDISICYNASLSAEQKRRVYVIMAREPLASQMVRRQCSEVEMAHMFR